jgi:hypothetical protein
MRGTQTVYVVLSHLEVEPNNFSTEVIRAFNDFMDAGKFAKKLKKQIKPGDLNEMIEIEELSVE